jgi:SNF2 family DNA or RNA helicase
MKTICDIARGAFPDDLQLRGEGYLRGGRVRVNDLWDNGLEVIVRGTKRYKAQIEIKQNAPVPQPPPVPMIWTHCTCPAFSNQGTCKHIWAMLRYAEEERLIHVPENARYGGDWHRYAKNLQEQKIAPPSEWQTQLQRLEKIATSQITTDTAPTATTEQELSFSLVPPHARWDPLICIRPMIRQKLKSGGWGKWKPFSPKHPSGDLPEQEYVLANAINGLNQVNANAFYRSIGGLTAEQASRLVPQLVATGKLFRQEEEEEDDEPLAWDDGEPFTCALEIKRNENNYALSTELRRDNEHYPLKNIEFIAANIGLLQQRLIRVQHTAADQLWIQAMTGVRDIEIPETEIRDFMKELLRRPALPPITLPENQDFAENTVSPQPSLALLKSTLRDNRSIPARAFFVYGETAFPALAISQKTKPPTTPAGKIILRDSVAEQNARERLFALGGKQPSYFERNDANIVFPANRLTELITTLSTEGWQVTLQEKLYRPSGNMSVSVKSGIDWFDLHAECDFGGIKADLPALLNAIREKEEWVELEDGTFGMLPTEWLKKWAPLAQLGKLDKEGIRFSRAQAGLLDAWLLEQPDVNVDDLFAQIRNRLNDFKSITPAKAPANFKGTLRDYQKEGIGWLFFLQEFGFGGCLADDMGLGKTIQMLALLETRRTQRKKHKLPPSLVVAPRSLIFNWIREAAQFTPRLRILDHTGTNRELGKGWEKTCDVVLTTYGTLLRDIGMLKDIEFDYAVLDESQAIKNAQALTSKSARLIKARHRVAMSGTPIENHLGELWSLMDFLNPGLLGHASGFNKTWGKDPDPQQRTILAKAMRPFILRRTKSQVAKELPERQEHTLLCELATKQREQYNDLRDHYRNSLMTRVDKEGLNRSKMHVLEALLRLRQAACHSALIDVGKATQACGKFEILLPRLDELIQEGHKALVFSQFTSFLAILKKRLDASRIPYEYLDGQTKDRQACVNRFQESPEIPLFLISLKAGGLGLNLTSADYVFLLDPWWNPAAEAQAIDRAHRIGQTNKVMAYRLIAKDTVEEKVLELQEKKRELAEAILSEDKALIRNLTREDLEMLLS